MIEKLKGLKIIMKEFDVVSLKEDYKEISKGTNVTIVLFYDEKNVKLNFLIKMEIQ